MNNLLDKLEKKWGRYAVKNLIYYVLAGYVVGYILYFLYYKGTSDIYAYITLNPAMVMHGQVWRLFTWILTVPQSLSIWLIFMFLFYFFIGKSLEQTMGAFKYNVYMFSGWFFTTFGAMLIYWISSAAGYAISISASTYYINMASFLAFAVFYPDQRVYFFGILPIKIKVLAWIDVGLLGLDVLENLSALFLLQIQNSSFYSQIISSSGMADTYASIISQYSVTSCLTGIFSVVISLVNFLIFFLIYRKERHNAKKRMHDFQRKAEQGRSEYASFTAGAGAYTQAASADNRQKTTFRPDSSSELLHKCSVCGRTNKTNPELQFRYCSKCSGNHEYCQDHLFTHVHIK